MGDGVSGIEGVYGGGIEGCGIYRGVWYRGMCGIGGVIQRGLSAWEVCLPGLPLPE